MIFHLDCPMLINLNETMIALIGDHTNNGDEADRKRLTALHRSASTTITIHTKTN